MLLFYTQRSWKKWNFSIAKSQAFGPISVKTQKKTVNEMNGNQTKES